MLLLPHPRCRPDSHTATSGRSSNQEAVRADFQGPGCLCSLGHWTHRRSRVIPTAVQHGGRKCETRSETTDCPRCEACPLGSQVDCVSCGSCSCLECPTSGSLSPGNPNFWESEPRELPTSLSPSPQPREPPTSLSASPALPVSGLDSLSWVCPGGDILPPTWGSYCQGSTALRSQSLNSL